MTSKAQDILLGIRGWIDHCLYRDEDDCDAIANIGHDLGTYFDEGKRPRLSRFKPSARTVEEQAKLMLGDYETFDTALPQGWVNSIIDKYHVSPVGMFVWWYPKDSILGKPFPLTDYAVELWAKVKEG